ASAEGASDRDRLLEREFGFALAAEQSIVAVSGLAGLLVLLDEGGDELDDELLLGARQSAGLLEDALQLADGPRPSRRPALGGDEEIVDADAEGLGHLGQDFTARRLLAPFPESDIGLGDVE
ncbi:MAG TPA: hypothetical protein PKE42_13730, partial [Arachnia sp.]|nr:hypothetical protein [Arachnia sp.]